MIPVRDVIPTRTPPIVTVGLLGVNALVFAFELSLPDAGLVRLFRTYGLVPTWFAWPATFTSIFLHAGWVHLIADMLYLWLFGENVEDRLGHARFLFFYVACGAVAAVSYAAVNPASGIPLVGAGGAVAGILGAYFIAYPRSRVLILVPLVDVIETPATFFLAFWFALQAFTGAGTLAPFSEGALLPHVAAFTVGALLGRVLRRRGRGGIEWWYRDGNQM
jgi:membrane associated rhomboid family serine protease